MAFKDRMVQEAERAIDSARKRRMELQDELAEVQGTEDEARAILQLLKSGKVVTADYGASKSMRSHEDYLEAIRVLIEDKGDFDAEELANLMEVTKGAATQKMKTLREEGFIAVSVERKPGIPRTRYKFATAVE
jgi:Fic family protein